MGIACVIHIEIAVRFDFPYKGGYYSDYVLGSLHTLITLSIMWNLIHFIRLVINLIHFIRLVIKNAPQNTEDN